MQTCLAWVESEGEFELSIPKPHLSGFKFLIAYPAADDVTEHHIVRILGFVSHQW